MNKKEVTNFLREDLNPCIDEGKLSMQCLEKHAYDASQCYVYFENYKQCKKFWGKITMARKKAGIKPYLPLPEERAKICEKRKLGENVISAN